MKNILSAYSSVVRDDLYDHVPKAIICLYIDKLLEGLDSTLPDRITRKNSAKNLCRID